LARRKAYEIDVCPTVIEALERRLEVLCGAQHAGINSRFFARHSWQALRMGFTVTYETLPSDESGDD